MSIAVHFIHLLLLLTEEFNIAAASNRVRSGEDADRNCTSGQLIEEPNGVVVSPGYWRYQKYPPNCHCSWAFPMDKEKFIRFRFRAFHLEQYNNCLKDQLNIISTASSENHILRRLCGQQIPKEITVPANLSILLEFYSDDIYEYRGFEIEYSTLIVNGGCQPGLFECRNAKCVPLEKICDEVDDCEDGTDEEACEYQMKLPTKCGSPTIQPDISTILDKIVGGSESIPGSWPWQISIQRSNTYPSGHYCGGAILEPSWIVTAGHCVHNQTDGSIRIHLGSHSEFENDEGEIIRHPKKIIIHPKFIPRNLKNDIALIQLNAPVRFSRTISNICLPSKDYVLPNKTRCVVTGWGSTYGSGHAGVLKQAVIPIISDEECEVLTKKKLSGSVLCAGFKGQTSCHGDSGGPLVCNSSLHNNWFLAGIVSTGPKLCGIKHQPSIFTKTTSYFDWINDIVWNKIN